MTRNRTAAATLLVVLLAVELTRRDGLTPWKTLGAAATGELVLK